MAAVFSFSQEAALKFCKRPSLPTLCLARPRGLNRHGRIHYRIPTGRKGVHSGTPEDVSKLRMVMRPLGFTIMTGAVSYGVCTIVNYERTRYSYIHGHKGHNSFSPRIGSPKQFNFRDVLNKWWNSLPGGSKTASVLIFLNTTVLLLWKMPRMQNFLMKWFTTSPGSGPSLSLLTSTFSHQDVWHLLVNMFVLWSFAPHIEAVLGKEQFIAFYLTGGVFASFASVAYRVATSRFVGVSLGASGALLAVLSLVCIHHPDTRLALVFLPFWTFSAGSGLLAIVGFDLAGLIFRWQFFDHAAHLGGVLFGAWYLKFGHHYLWAQLLKQWHKLRTGSKRT